MAMSKKKLYLTVNSKTVLPFACAIYVRLAQRHFVSLDAYAFVIEAFTKNA